MSLDLGAVAVSPHSCTCPRWGKVRCQPFSESGFLYSGGRLLRQQYLWHWAAEGVLCKTTDYAGPVFVSLPHPFLNVCSTPGSFSCLPDTQHPMLLSETNGFGSPHKASQNLKVNLKGQPLALAPEWRELWLCLQQTTLSSSCHFLRDTEQVTSGLSISCYLKHQGDNNNYLHSTTKL